MHIHIKLHLRSTNQLQLIVIIGTLYHLISTTEAVNNNIIEDEINNDLYQFGIFPLHTEILVTRMKQLGHSIGINFYSTLELVEAFHEEYANMHQQFDDYMETTIETWKAEYFPNISQKEMAEVCKTNSTDPDCPKVMRYFAHLELKTTMSDTKNKQDMINAELYSIVQEILQSYPAFKPRRPDTLNLPSPMDMLYIHDESVRSRNPQATMNSTVLSLCDTTATTQMLQTYARLITSFRSDSAVEAYTDIVSSKLDISGKIGYETMRLLNGMTADIQHVLMNAMDRALNHISAVSQNKFDNLLINPNLLSHLLDNVAMAQESDIHFPWDDIETDPHLTETYKLIDIKWCQSTAEVPMLAVINIPYYTNQDEIEITFIQTNIFNVGHYGPFLRLKGTNKTFSRITAIKRNEHYQRVKTRPRLITVGNVKLLNNQTVEEIALSPEESTCVTAIMLSDWRDTLRLCRFTVIPRTPMLKTIKLDDSAVTTFHYGGNGNFLFYCNRNLKSTMLTPNPGTDIIKFYDGCRITYVLNGRPNVICSDIRNCDYIARIDISIETETALSPMEWSYILQENPGYEREDWLEPTTTTTQGSSSTRPPALIRPTNVLNTNLKRIKTIVNLYNLTRTILEEEQEDADDEDISELDVYNMLASTITFALLSSITLATSCILFKYGRQGVSRTIENLQLHIATNSLLKNNSG